MTLSSVLTAYHGNDGWGICCFFCCATRGPYVALRCCELWRAWMALGAWIVVMAV